MSFVSEIKNLELRIKLYKTYYKETRLSRLERIIANKKLKIMKNDLERAKRWLKNAY